MDRLVITEMPRHLMLRAPGAVRSKTFFLLRVLIRHRRDRPCARPLFSQWPGRGRFPGRLPFLADARRAKRVLAADERGCRFRCPGWRRGSKGFSRLGRLVVSDGQRLVPG